MVSPHLTPTSVVDAKDATAKEIVRNLAPIIGLISVVPGSIYSGWATPSEATAIGVFAALTFALFSGQLSRKMLSVSWVRSDLVWNFPRYND